MQRMYVLDQERLRPVESPSTRPLRWAAWRPGGAWALVVGNRGEAWRFDGADSERLDSGCTDNLRAVAWSPDGARALLAGNRGALLLSDGERFEQLERATTENLRRAAWAPDNRSALIIGNAGTVLHFDASTGALRQLPGDRAHTMRSIAWRPDGAYALIGAYASRFAGYPRPHVLYRCDGRYTQALLATDGEDDAVAIDWRPGASPPRALVLVVSYDNGGSGTRAMSNKLFEYDGAGFSTTPLETPAALIGAAWRPDGEQALICGERGTLLRFDGRTIEPITSSSKDNLVGPFWHPTNNSALLLRGPDEKVYTV